MTVTGTGCSPWPESVPGQDAPAQAANAGNPGNAENPGKGGAAASEPAPATSAPKKITYPNKGSGRWRIAKAGSDIAGRSGKLLRYRIAVEDEIQPVRAADFGTAVTKILADPRGWTGDGEWRLQQAAAGTPYDFTIYLATPVTRSQLCADLTDRYTSCRTGDKVVINVTRWVEGIPDYGAPLSVYREYLITHEVGHRLGQNHQLCPGKGKPAPVMQQQTLGMHGCVANSWHMIDDEPYEGRAGAYDDPIPDA
jgi:hypothetical protein